MAKKLILAVAGSGKTYTLCHKLDQNKRNIIVAYTNQNIKNIHSELIEIYGKIPYNTLIMTYDKFVYKYLIRPFDKLIGQYYEKNDFFSSGLTIENPPPTNIEYKDNNGNKKYRPNPYYKKDIYLEHYINSNKYYYCDYTASLVNKIKKVNGKKFINYGIDYLNKFFDDIYIDEVQDFRNHEWELLLSLAKKLPNILLVGDYYQNSVSGSNNNGKPFKDKSYEEYVTHLTDNGITVDTETLIKSRRCSVEVCNLITEKLNVRIESSEINTGTVNWITDNDEIINILENDNIIKIVEKNSKKYKFNAINWGYSKGDTYDNACVILTGRFENLDSTPYHNNDISSNNLYVALSRTKGNLYIIKKSNFDYVKNKYIK